MIVGTNKGLQRSSEEHADGDHEGVNHTENRSDRLVFLLDVKGVSHRYAVEIVDIKVIHITLGY